MTENLLTAAFYLIVAIDRFEEDWVYACFAYTQLFKKMTLEEDAVVCTAVRYHLDEGLSPEEAMSKSKRDILLSN